jgi:SAM-dependent methyltransferase
LLPRLLEEERHVIAVDHSERSLEVAGGRAPNERRLELRIGDLRALPVEDELADRVVCAEVLQHVPGDAQRLQAVRELHRVLRPGGLLGLTAYRWRGHVRRAKEGFWGSGLYRYAFTVRELAALLERAGFEDVTAGGAVILPGLAKRIGMSAEAQRRLAFTPVGRSLAHYVVAGGRKP